MEERRPLLRNCPTELACRVVAAYEDSVGRPSSRRFTERADDGRAVPSRALGDVTGGVMAAYADRCARYLAFGAEMREMLEGSIPPRRMIAVMPDTPPSLREIGCADLPLAQRQSAARRAAAPEGGGIGATLLRRLPELLERPVAVYAARDLEHVVAVLEATDGAGLPVVANVRPYGANRDLSAPRANVVGGVYGKRTTVAALDGAAREGRLLSVSQRRLEALLARSGERVPASVAAQGDGQLRRLMAPPKVGAQRKGKKSAPAHRGGGRDTARGRRPPGKAARSAASPREERARAHAAPRREIPRARSPLRGTARA